MVHLFATLPAEKLHGIPSKIVHTSRRLALEWQVSRPLSPFLRKMAHAVWDKRSQYSPGFEQSGLT